MPDHNITIEFPDVTPDKAGTLAESLRGNLSGIPDVTAKLQRTKPDAQDLGASLVLVLGAPAVVIAAKAIRDWVRRQGRTKLVINGNVITDVNSEDAAAIIRALEHPEEGKKNHGKTSTQG
jgi:hypothetical protein